jgi:hypothetical protein
MVNVIKINDYKTYTIVIQNNLLRVSNELKLKHNEKKKLNEWNKSLFSYLQCGRFNLKLSSFTFKRDKMHLVASICMLKFGQISPQNPTNIDFD